MGRATVLKRFELSPEAATRLEERAATCGMSQTAFIQDLIMRAWIEPVTMPASPDVQTDSNLIQCVGTLPSRFSTSTRSSVLNPKNSPAKAESVDGTVGPRGFRARAESVGDAVPEAGRIGGAPTRAAEKFTAALDALPNSSRIQPTATGAYADAVERAEKCAQIVTPEMIRQANCHHFAKDRVGSKCTACGVSL